MKKTCIYCDRTIIGRSDKKFCSIECKNKYHWQQAAKTKKIFQKIDKILHRNHQILKSKLGDQQKVKAPKHHLELLDFNFHYFTGILHTKNQTTYYCLYDLAWCQISSSNILIVHRKIDL